MALDSELFDRPAIRGDVSGVAIEVVLALRAVSTALTALHGNKKADISTELSTINEAADELEKRFDELTGWTKNNAT